MKEIIRQVTPPKKKKIIDYRIQSYRLLKWIATAYAIKFAGKWMNETFTKFNDVMGTGTFVDEDGIVEIHATSAGLKGLCTKLAADGIEDCRKCCGGHGYLLASGVAALAADYVWQTTAEGDFVVMLLQNARYLIKCYNRAKKGKQLPPFMQYLVPVAQENVGIEKERPRDASSPSDFRNLEYLSHLYRYSALIATAEAAKQISSKFGASKKDNSAFNASSMYMLAAAETHCYYFILSKFIDVVNNLNDSKDKKIKNVLLKLCSLFACVNIWENMGKNFWKLSGNQRNKIAFEELLKENVNDLLVELRDDAIGLVDAFDFPDVVLNSVLGRRDGNVYEALYDSARKSNLNKKVPFDGYQYLRPYLDIEFLKLKNKKPNTGADNKSKL